jgi:hypothetical protein
VDLLGSAWRYGAPALLVICSLAMLKWTIRAKPAEISINRRDWPWLFLVIMWTGDAALGDSRPPFERAWKGAVATLLWLSVAITLWRRRRHRASVTVPDSPEKPPS